MMADRDLSSTALAIAALVLAALFLLATALCGDGGDGWTCHVLA